jgi:hypothetical protein
LKKSWKGDSYWFSDKWFLYSNMYYYDDFLNENLDDFFYFDSDDLSYDEELNTTFPYKNNLWFFSKKLLGQHKVFFDSDSLYNDFVEDSVDWQSMASSDPLMTQVVTVEPGFMIFRESEPIDDRRLAWERIAAEKNTKILSEKYQNRRFVKRKKITIKKQDFFKIDQ